ncbi:MAG: M23 family metallopeptidase [Gracilimonas sp.]|uniref:M23 family metallopeptidase n=1 Tax=Gracilimonas sp. TaxID=1974203 RepID=UPI001B2CF381|nr:M23 family metallopeptidase [Gracilimonas sp.]MBO6585780.1 M23 family metallopeptidase [Gracilimonas sp.]MBO6616777.1 M23 family metallopeptidase [Gracilimonas sp.]
MRLFSIAIFSLFITAANVQAQEYLWPSASGNYLSSTFGETRSAHFHAGLDIKTWGREGYKVFASRDGTLFRLLVTERGYGNAIYLQHDDGTFTVYAHLQRFKEQFQSIADSIRLQDFSFEMDAFLDTLAIQVNQGDVIGYTGSTGIGPPHLHFEIRDSLETPVNALRTNLSIKDDLPPVFSSLIVEPLTKNSRVNGQPASNYIRAGKSKEVFDFGEVKLTEKAGLAVNVYDRADEVYNAYAVYSLALVQDSDTLFYQELNRFDYNESNEMFLDRIAPFGSTRRGHQRLYRKDGSKNPFYLITKETARVGISDSSETYTIVASDYFGNTSRATVTFVPDTLSNSSSVSLTPNTDEWYWAENWASPDLQNTLDLTQLTLGIKWEESQHIVRVDSSKQLQFARITPGSAQKIVTPDHRLKLRFGEKAFFDTLTVASSYEMDNEAISISVQPEMLPAKSNFGLEFFLGDYFEAGNNYRLFRIDASDGDTSYVESELTGRTLHARPSSLGEFTVLADNEAPEISGLNIYKTDYGKWRASVRVTDDLTGIESSSAKFIMNGQRGIAEYDYEEELLIYYLPEFTPQAANSAVVEIKDKAGNIASKEFQN